MKTELNSLSTKGIGIVIGKEEGESFWQPTRSNGHITIKTSPWNIPHTQQTIFLTEMPPGGIVGKHYHEDQEEIFICLSGKAIIEMDDKEHELMPEMIAYIGKKVWHSIKAIGETPFRAMVIISPSGLEERFKQMGKPRKPGDLPPEPFESLAGPEGHGVKRT